MRHRVLQTPVSEMSLEPETAQIRADFFDSFSLYYKYLT